MRRRRHLRRLCQGDCDCHARVLYRARRTDGRTDGRNERGKEFKKWRSQSCEKKSVRRSLSRPAARARRVVRPPLPLLLRPVLPSVIRSARRPLLVNSFPNVQIPRLSVVLEFFQVRVERGKEEKKSISAATPPLSLYPSIGSCYAAVTAAAIQELERGEIVPD